MVCLKLDQAHVLDHYRVIQGRPHDSRLDHNMERALTNLSRLIQRFEASAEI